ncbi:MAG: asparagine synthase-related protein [Chloroflexota bacterium]
MNAILGQFDQAKQLIALENPFNDANLAIVANAHLHNYSSLLTKLQLAERGQRASMDCGLILAAYKQWGRACVHHLQGAFAFAIWDKRNQTLFCARDRMGIYPFYYYRHRTKIAFASAMRPLVRLPYQQLTPNPRWAVDHLCGIWLDKENTFYNEIYRLPPAHTLTITPNHIQKQRYWDFDLNVQLRLKSDADYIDAARRHLTKAVQRTLCNTMHVGLELSGGIDSTTIAALAYAAQKKQPALRLSTYSHASPAGMAGQQHFRADERANIDLVRAHVGIEASHFYTNEQATVQPLIRQAFDLGGGVDRCTFAMLTSGIHALAAAQGVTVMLSGWGGDELVSSRLPTSRYLLQAHQWWDLWAELSIGGTVSQLRTFRKLLVLLREEWVPWGRATSHQRAEAARLARRTAYIQEQLTAAPELYDYMGAIDWRERLHHWWQVKGQRPNTYREAQYQRLSSAWLTNRLEATAVTAATSGIDYRYPLLDIDLLTFFLALPVTQKRRHGQGRYLLRQATADWLPEQIRWAKKEPGDLYPWFIHSLQNELDQDIEPVPDDAPEEVKFGRLIAQAKREVFRKRLA